MEKWLFVVETNCANPAREKEFNEWYDKVHVPDVLEARGIVGARRFVIQEPAQGRGKFLALYEVETDNIGKTMAALQEHMTKKREQGRHSDLVSVAFRGVYKQI